MSAVRIADPDLALVRSTRTWTRADVAVVAGCVLAALALVWLAFHFTPLSGPLGFTLCLYIAFVATYAIVARDVYGGKLATDRLAAIVIGSAAALVVGALITIIGYVALKGAPALRPGFFVRTLRGVGPSDAATAGGALHAIVGTFQQVGIAVLLSVPLGVSAAVFLNEIGGRSARLVRFMVDAMSGVPSIVAGLFIYAVWIVQLGHEFSGLAAGLALSILMLPSVVRTSEEVLRLVPGGLREASLALGAPEWRTVWQVVLPTARAGVITAVILGVARAVGETAPLIMTSFGNTLMEVHPLAGPQESLPHFVFDLIRSPFQSQIDRAWTGAFVLIAIVLALFTVARLLGGRKGGR